MCLLTSQLSDSLLSLEPSFKNIYLIFWFVNVCACLSLFVPHAFECPEVKRNRTYRWLCVLGIGPRSFSGAISALITWVNFPAPWDPSDCCQNQFKNWSIHLWANHIQYAHRAPELWPQVLLDLHICFSSASYAPPPPKAHTQVRRRWGKAVSVYEYLKEFLIIEREGEAFFLNIKFKK